ncbi:MAG TPA: metalloregulator ArsR/SmtB family transcription factor [Burkholderiaceae bacterium]|nr:metalloregulator ArsR/SmtB family transcription factor [Burkholderiaceae bacterium]
MTSPSAPSSSSSAATKKAAAPRSPDNRAQDKVFDAVAELFSVLSTPIRLKIISAVCQHERTVSQLLEEIDTTQPNMSQHLATLYRSGVLSKRREGTQMVYSLRSERVAALCRAVCTQVAIELNSENGVPPSERLVPVTPD